MLGPVPPPSGTVADRADRVVSVPRADSRQEGVSIDFIGLEIQIARLRFYDPTDLEGVGPVLVGRVRVGHRVIHPVELRRLDVRREVVDSDGHRRSVREPYISRGTCNNVIGAVRTSAHTRAQHDAATRSTWTIQWSIPPRKHSVEHHGSDSHAPFSGQKLLAKI